MSHAAAIDDLFGHVPQRKADADAPVIAEHRFLYPPVPDGGHTADTIRPILLRVLAEARAQSALAWDARTLRSHTAMVPYMAEWLKGGEGDGLLAEFKAEMDRLDAPVDQVAPNWRRIWGLAA